MEFSDEFSFSELMDFTHPERLLASQALSPLRSVPYHQFLAAGDEVGDSGDNPVPVPVFVPRPAIWSVAERLIHAMSLLKVSDAAGILAQVWVPVRQGNRYVLTTCDQPYYMMDKRLAGYREESRWFNFAAENTPGSFLGLPGRVFTSKVPEWTSDLNQYNRSEFARVDLAREYKVRGSLAVPIMDPNDRSCCAVLELATSAMKANFDEEFSFVTRVTEAVDLQTVTSHLHPRIRNLSKNEDTVFSEINDVLRVICPAYNLPLALTWILCPYANGFVSDAQWGRDLLCIQESACYLNDQKMEGFFRVCVGHHLQKGQGIAGKALQSEHAFFSPNVKNYHIQDYPLVHHARKFGLNAAVAIRLRSTFTGDRDYILELFMPTSCVTTDCQQLLLNRISSRMHRICKSLSTKEKAKLRADGCDISYVCDEPSHEHLHQQETTEAFPDSTQKLDKKQNMLEKSVSLNTLTKHFSSSLKDAAKNLGVCPTTLKKICRGHGITKWPYRKFGKVNRYLKKIQVDMESVKEADRALNFDSISCSFYTTTSAIPQFPGTQSGNYSTRDYMKNVEGESQVYPKRKRMEDKEDVQDGQWFSGLITELAPLHLNEGITYGQRVSKGEFENHHTSESSNSVEHNANSRPGLVSKFVERYHKPSLSSMPCASCGHCSLMDNSASTSLTLALNNRSKIESSMRSGGFAFSVKANYKEAVVRFKFKPSMGYYHLYDEIGQRFGLASGSYQLKYLDDEKEWILLVSQTDLEECIDVNVSSRGCVIKLMVHELPSTANSSMLIIV